MEKVEKIKRISKEILKNGFPVLFIGDRGIGKTSVAWEIAKEMGLEVFYLNVSQMFPENLSFPKEENNLLKFITFDLNNKIVLLDEITNRNPDMHSLLQSLILDKRIGTRQFENIYFIGTGNNPENSSVATYLPRPLIERFVKIDFPIPSKEEWAKYTLNKGGSKIFVDFILQSNSNLYYKNADNQIDLEQYPSPRNNTRTAILLKEILHENFFGNESSLNAVKEELEIIISGSSGKEVYTAFISYLLNGRYYSYKLFRNNDFPKNDNEILSLITDVAELLRKGEINMENFADVFDYLYLNNPRYCHYLLSYTALVIGNQFRSAIYQNYINNDKHYIGKYLKKVHNSSS